MPDPVDTDALRQSAQFLHKAYPGPSAQVTAAADEVDRLSAAIENAPHDIGCASLAESLLGVARDPERPCTCWKSEI